MSKKAKISNEQLLAALEETAQRLGVTVRYEKIAGGPIKTTSGACRIRDEHVILVDKRLNTVERVHALKRELNQFNLEEVYVPPAARQFLLGEKPSG